jgi:hypothetical protein
MNMTGKMRLVAGAGMAAILALAGGCNRENKPTPANFTKTLNTWFQDRSDCLFPPGHAWPWEVAPSSTAKEEKQQLDSLTNAGLLTRLEDRDMHVDRYTLNLAGQRFAPRFCYGHREVTGIVSNTPPGPKDGFTETTVTYQYVMRDVPVWATTDEVKAGFPAVAKSLGNTPTDQITLATVGAGWQVPR